MNTLTDQPKTPADEALDRSRARRAITLLVASAILIVTLTQPAAASTAGTLLFFDGTNWVTASLDGRDRAQITHEGVGSDEGLALSAARLSPNGRRIVRADQGGQRIIHTALDGTDLRVVVENDRFGHFIGANNKNPFWSPDGDEIAYFTDRNYRWELWVSPADGSNEGRRLATVTANGSSTFADITGDWSSPADMVAYSYSPPNQLELGLTHVLDSRGRAHASFAGLWPSFSPDGTTIATTNPTTGRIELRSTNGGNLRSLPVMGAWVKWSADGTHLLAASLDGDVISMTSAGTDVQILIDDSRPNVRPDWTLASRDVSVSSLTCMGLEATIIGTAGNDRLVGTPGPDVIVGLGGRDVIRGAEGDDVICGNGGDDTLIGGAGADRLRGGFGADTLRGGTGPDVIHGEAGNDRLFGGNGRDLLNGGDGRDHIQGGKHGDRISGNAANDILWGGGGHDVILGGSGPADTIVGGLGRDTCSGASAVSDCEK